MGRGLAASVGVGLVLVALWLWNCTGPRPEVTSVRRLPPVVAGLPYRVEAEIDNHWGGLGDVAVVVRLRDRASGRTVQADDKLQLDRYERAHWWSPSGRPRPASTCLRSR
jgi:hypothetical protein